MISNSLAIFRRWDSPPLSVVAGWPSWRYSNPTSFKAECPSDKINHSFDISIQEESNLASKIETIEFQEEPTIANHSQNLSHEIDKKIDEALELAERMKFSESIDEIEIPTFLRNGLSDLSIN